MMEGSIASKIHAAKVDQKYPSFRVLSCHQVVKYIKYKYYYSHLN
jgi:ribosomal protein L15E